MPKMPKTTPKRLSEPGKRHRRDNGPEALEVEEAPELTQADLGTTTFNVQELVGRGADALRRAHHDAAKLSKRFGAEFEAKWLLLTPWLAQRADGSLAHELNSRNANRPIGPDGHPLGSRSLLKLLASHRGCARYALIWRPRYLAALALTRSPIIAARAAKVSGTTANQQRRDDPEFAAQCEAAEEHAIQLLHDACFASALEGDCEPVYWQGIRVGHVRKFDSRLRIEMLRAHLPTKFKAPGQASIKINAGNGASVLVIGEQERDELVALRQQALTRIIEKKAQAIMLPS